MRKNILLIGIILCAFAIIYKFRAPSHDDNPLIFITQIIEHKALDQEREGLIRALRDQGFEPEKNITMSYHNAQGSLSTASQIITQGISLEPKVIVAISTPSAQAALIPAKSKNIPLVFTAVTDPLKAKLVSDLEKRTENITGVTDALPLESQVELIQDFLPTIKNLGVIYNTGEMNSVEMVNKFKNLLKEKNINIIEGAINKTSDIAGAVSSLIGKVEAIYIPNDNTAVSGISSITQIAYKENLPVFAGDIGSVEEGAIAAKGYDRKELGYKVGLIVGKILKGKKAHKIPVIVKHPLKIFLNKKAAQKINLPIPSWIEKDAQIIGEKISE